MSTNNTSTQAYAACHKVLGTAELLEQIQLSMSPTDAVHSRLVCKMFERSFEESKVLQTHCFYRQDSNPPGGVSVINSIMLHTEDCNYPRGLEFYDPNDKLDIPQVRMNYSALINVALLTFDEMPWNVKTFYGNMFFADRPIDIQVLLGNPEPGMGMMPHWGSWGEARVTLRNPTLGQVVEAAHGLIQVARHWRDLLENHSSPADSEDDSADEGEDQMEVEEEEEEEGEEGEEGDGEEAGVTEQNDAMDVDDGPAEDTADEESEDPRACTCVMELGGNDCDQHWDWKDVFGKQLAKLCVYRPTVDDEDIWRKRYDPDLE